MSDKTRVQFSLRKLYKCCGVRRTVSNKGGLTVRVSDWALRRRSATLSLTYRPSNENRNTEA